ncbi:hypothetical protein L6164_035724 [Bauhinia variegata]|uniref:Uncharacterized protein n=1 Tax=Bauhinia variegata TaxID=167791 RepID=A0ACB9KEV9_BAUVA|nr:hypothetical protein L6164_035724 [Bauhinia variegata]
MTQHLKHVLCLVLALAAVVGAKAALSYEASNNAGSSAGGIRFDKEIGIDYAKQTLSAATYFIHKLFQQTNDADMKPVQKISMVVENIEGFAYASNSVIHVSAAYIEHFPGDVKNEITGLLYHELTHLLQWDANGKAPSGLIEGIADFVRLKAELAPKTWAPVGRGDNWDQGYEITAHFLDYCNGIKDGFVAELNKRLKNDYNDSYFNDILEKPVSQLWGEYKAKYATPM